MKRLWNLCNKKSLQARRATTGRSRLRRLIIELLDERIPLAADAQMIKDINLLPTTFVSSPRNFTEIGNTVFFTAKTAATGEELWKTDGTTVGTVRVKDIAPGDISSISNLSQFENVNGVLYFSANDSFSGNELWRSDGTESGTYRVKDIGIGAESASPDYLTNINGSLFFSAFDTANGVELWKSDGTEAGTVRVKDIYIGSGSSSPSYLLNANGTLFFTAKDNSSGFEIWKSDGTESGTNRIKDINPGLAHSSQLARPVLLNNTVFFVATDGVRGYELWKTDGSSDGTVLVKDIETGNAQDSYPSELVNVDGALFFSANNSITGDELWKSDGTTNGTVLVKDIRSGSSGSSIAYSINYNGLLVFTATNGSNGFELWRSDGSAIGTVQIKDIFPGSGSALPSNFEILDGLLYFSANDGTNGYELWKSDGTTNGTVLVKDIRSGVNGSTPKGIANIKGSLYFSADDGASGTELWTSDGSNSGTLILKNITDGTGNSFHSMPGQYTGVNSSLFFLGYDGVHGTELWKSDGTVSGTQLVKDIRSGSSGTIAYSGTLLNNNGVLFFNATDGVNGDELWRSDGTASGTFMLKNIRSGSLGSKPFGLTNVNGTTFFVANDGSTGYELWKSDGTEAGTVRVKDIRSGTSGSSIRYMVNMSGVLYFRANDGTSGYELWRSDGTSTGTIRVKDIRAGGLHSSPSNLTNVNGVLFFTATDSTAGRELWKSDGSDTGTVRVGDIRSGSIGSYPDTFANVGGNLYFRANDGTSGYELWKSDGSSTGTLRVKDIRPGTSNSDPRSLTSFNGSLFFSANDGTNGSELWKSDGTESGTVMVKNIIDGVDGSSPTYFEISNGKLFFRAFSNPEGLQLWVSDGTNNGTQRLETLTGSSTGVFPMNLINVDNTLFYTAIDDRYGRELWRVSITDSNQPPTDIALSSTSIPENAGANAVIGTLSTTDPNPGDSFTYSLISGIGSTDNAAFNISGDKLRATNSLDFETKSSYSVRVRSTDQTGLFVEKSFLVSVSNVNEVPSDISLSSNSIAENAVVNATVGSLATTDPDVGNTFTYTLVVGAGAGDNGAFNINGSNLRASSSFNFESMSSYSVRVRSTDQGGLYTEKIFVINVSNINEEPTDINLSNATLAENSGVNAIVGSLGTVDDTQSNVIANFDNLPLLPAINSYGNLRDLNNGSSDYLGVTWDTRFQIVGRDYVEQWVNQGPNTYAKPRSASYVAFNANGENGLTLQTSKVLTGAWFARVDLGNGPYGATSITIHALNGSTVLGSVSMELTSTNPTFINTRTFLNLSGITGYRIDRTPQVSGIASRLGSWIADDFVFGDNSQSSFIYSLVPGTGSTDNSAFNISGNTLRATGSFNFEAKSSYSVRVRSTDTGGLWAEKEFIISVTDLNETPTNISLTGSYIVENAGVNILVGTLSTADPDAANTFTYNLVSGTGSIDNNKFIIDGSNLRAKQSFDFESKSSYSIRIRSTDQGGLFTEKPFVVGVTDINEAPTDIRFSTRVFTEDFSNGLNQWTNISGMVVADPLSSGRGNVLTFGQIRGGGDLVTKSVFSKGDLWNVSFDYLGTPGKGGIANDLGGYLGISPSSYWMAGTSSNWATPINLIDDNQWRRYSIDWSDTADQRLMLEDWDGSGGVPGDTLFDNILITKNTYVATTPENGVPNSFIATLGAKDPDASNTINFALVSGVGDSDNSSFTIIDGALHANNRFDFDTKSIYSVRVRATDQNGLSFEKALSIQVTNVPETITSLEIQPLMEAGRFFNRMDSATSEYMTGIYTTSSVENFSTVGHDGNTFSGSFIKSSGSATLIITDLPRHDSVDIGFLLSIIEAWDGFERGPSYSGDYFNVLVDGVPVFRESFSTFSLSEQSYVPPVGALLSYGTNLGYGPYTDSAYNMAFEPRLQQIPHTSSTLSITWESNGPGWEGVGEAWGVDNLSIKLWDSTASPANQVKSYSYSFPATATGEYDLVSTQRFSGLGSGLNTFSNDLLQSRGSATFTFMGLPEHQRIDVGFLLALFDTWDGFERGPSYSGDYFNVLVDGKPIFRESFSNFTLSEQSYVPPAGALLSFGTNLTNDPAYDSAYNMGLEPRLQQIPHTSSNLTLTFLSNGPGMDEYWGMDNLSVRLWNGSRTIDVSSAIGTNVGKLVTWDEPSASGYTYSLVTGTGDTDNSRFSITGGNLQLAQLLDPDPRNYSVRVRTTNAIGSTSDRSFIITTGVVNQAPTDIQLSKTTLQENLPTGSTVAFLEASDPQNTNNFVFQLVDGEGDLDNANFTISGNTLKTAKNLDREAKQINSIRIRATDAGGLFKDKIVDISISDSPFDIQIARDGNPINGSGNPSSMVQIGNIVYFVASHPMFGTELWRTDGTSLGTFLLKDINPGSFSSSVSNLTNVNGTLYFRANDGSLGQELWKSDGTEQGTVLVKDSRPGSLGSNPTFLFNHNGTLYFRATDGSSGYELWKSDGSTSGTVLVRDINPGTNGSFPFYFTNINGVLIFRAVNSTTGTELWKSDGTSTGTQIIKDIFSGASSSYPASLTNVNGTLFFRAADGAGGAELWKSDGTSAGTTQVKDIRPGTNGSNLSYVSNVSGTLFFRANDGTSGYELWKSDGSSVGTVRVKDIRAGISNSNPSALTNLNGTLFFTATDGSSGYELWKSNGTDAGTVRVKDIRAGVYDARPSNLTNLNGTLVFRANDGSNGDELWRTDGSDAGTKRLKEIKLGSSGSNPTQLTNIGGILYFNANDGTTGYELWRSDGLEASTYRLKDIWSGSADGTSNTSLFLNTNGILYYTSNDGLNGIELWRSDSTLSGSIQIKDIFPSSGSSSPSQLTNVNGTVFFQANDGVNNSELWKTDGTTAGTTLVKDIRTGYLGSTPGYLTNINGTLFFAATDSTNGRELWKSDGTTSGTTLVRDIRSGLSNADISNLVNINGTLFFRANDGTSGSELWKSDGTTNGTVRVKDIRPGSFGSQLSQLTNIGGILYFTANDGTNGYELWKSDGTESGTTLVKDISLGLLSSSPESLTSVNDLVYFVASNLDNGWELWKSDGTTAGTVRVKDIQVGSGSSYPRNLTNVNGTLFFRANDGTSGTELWKTDGTETGTVVVKDINTGGGNSTPSYLVNVNGVLYFSADNGINGSELWKSQGTSAGTVRVASMTSMPVGVVPTTLTNVSGLLYFTARDPSRGRELWFLDDNFVPSDISLTNWFIPEGLDPNASIGLFSSVDPDNGDLFTYAGLWHRRFRQRCVQHQRQYTASNQQFRL
jgi:ELWxxDGT repeat protein